MVTTRCGGLRARLSVCLLVLGVIAAGCGQEDPGASPDGEPGTAVEGTDDGASPTEKLELGVLYPFEIDDGGYAQANHEALLEAIAAIGEDRFEVREVENVPYTDQMTQTTLQLFRTGSDVVIELNSSGPLFFAACEQVPDKRCLTLYPSGDPPTADMPPNTSGFYYDTPSMFYAQGVAAGHITETGILGFVGSLKQAFAISNLNAFALGCQSVRPDCRVRNVYLNTFYDPPKTIEVVNSLADAGADVFAHYLDDTSTLTTAHTRGGMAFGYYRPEQAEAQPEAWVSAVNLRAAWVEVYKQELQALLDDTWTPGRVVLSVYESPLDESFDGFEHLPGMQLAPWGENVPQEAIDAAEEVLAEIATGGNPFQGPIYDADGEERVPEGEELNRNLLGWEWDWPVQGVIGG